MLVFVLGVVAGVWCWCVGVDVVAYVIDYVRGMKPLLT